MPKALVIEIESPSLENKPDLCNWLLITDSTNAGGSVMA